MKPADRRTIAGGIVAAVVILSIAAGLYAVSTPRCCVTWANARGET